MKILKLKVEQGVFFSGDLGAFFSGAGTEHASAQQHASSGARQRHTTRRPRGTAWGRVRWLRGGASAGARVAARHGAGVHATTSRWTERGARGVAAAAQREERAARGQTAAGGEHRRLEKRERNLGFEMDPRTMVVCTNLKQ